MAVTEKLELKKCSACKNYKTINNFSKNSQQKSGLHPSCKECKNKKNKEQWNSLSSGEKYNRARERQLKYRYNITPSDYSHLFNLQNGKCAICKKNSESWNGKHLTVDHDHKTGAVRGLLCSYCNSALGKFEDNPEILINAFKYLTKKEGDYFGCNEQMVW